MPDLNYIKLSDLNRQIEEIITQNFGGRMFWVVGDVTNHTHKHEKNYHYFDFVEKDPYSNGIIAKISASAWGIGSEKIYNFETVTGQKFTNNINVLLLVSVQFHSIYGFKLNVIDIDANFTLGVLEQQRQATLSRLVAENPGFIQKAGDQYYTKNNRLNHKIVIQRIALITSQTSAGGEDFRHTLDSNPHGYKFQIDDYFTVVQGENNAELLVAKIIEVFNSQIPYDAVVIIRGGGAQTDFLLFDDYNVGRAVARFPIPIITGIGHQKNETITDLMAHSPTKTPTKAAEFIIAHNKQFEENLLLFQKNIVIKSQQFFSYYFQKLASLNSLIVNNSRNIIAHNKDGLVEINQITINTSKSIIFNRRSELTAMASQLASKPKIIVYNRLADIKNIAENIKTFNAQYLKNQRSYLGHYVSLINLMSPKNILKKGFAIIKVNNEIISNPDGIKVGNEIDIILAETQITSTVKDKTTYNGNDFNV
ncbi:exodeoxyribonuclease VII large subunit [Niastella yeongjuensis]|uniref:Exodeoxyribonuclease 7 large subunit n=2 Tax=Niastella yeongjuensis TaxID=354355 RepID=A0A1V9EVA4_9BACT|nr:exodeoxyribonuclease VII large subunit [Niastella yeongjuensis]